VFADDSMAYQHGSASADICPLSMDSPHVSSSAIQLKPWAAAYCHPIRLSKLSLLISYLQFTAMWLP
jgi:hypothetical protein